MKGSSEKELKELKEKNEQLQVRIDETRREKQVVEERALTAANSADDFSSQLSAKLAEISALHGVCCSGITHLSALLYVCLGMRHR